MNLDILILQEQLKSRQQADLRVKVTPKSSRTELGGFLPDGTMKIKVQAVPEKGRANAELCAFLAKLLNLPKKNITILRGETSPIKYIRILSKE